MIILLQLHKDHRLRALNPIVSIIRSSCDPNRFIGHRDVPKRTARARQRKRPIYIRGARRDTIGLLSLLFSRNGPQLSMR